MLKDRKGTLIGESATINLCWQPGFVIDVPSDVGSTCLFAVLVERCKIVALEISETKRGVVFMDVDEAIKAVSKDVGLVFKTSNMTP